MSCGVQPDMWFSNYQRVGAGVHTIASIMPTHRDSDTTSTRFRGLYFANTYASGFNRAVVHDWVTSTFNNVSSGRSCVFGGGWHGIAGCGAYITLSIDSSEERAVWGRDSERWTYLPNDNNDAAGNLWFAWRYTCNYDCNNIPWQMSPGGILQPAAEAALPAPLVTPGEDRRPRPGRAFQLAETRSGVRLGAGVKRSLAPDGAIARHGREGGYVRRPNGWAYALSDTASPALKARPYADKPEVHHARALEYFGRLGLPKDEVGGIHVSTTMSGKGPAAAWSPADRRKDTFEGYTSHLERFLAGTRVVGSFAWVRFNEQAQVVEEGVYWPAVDERVVAEAVRFQEALADEGRRQEFLRRAAGSVQGEVDDSGEVVIVHSAAAHSGPFEAFAAYRVTPRGERKQVTRYFDAGGVERPVRE
jgi:hypothetical protein